MRTPSESKIKQLAECLGFSFAEGEIEDYEKLVADTLDLLDKVNDMPAPRLMPTEYEYTDRSPGYEPDEQEDPYNAWITKCHVKGADDGPLSGMTVGLKDNVSLAGIPLTNGSEMMQGYVPDADATVVTRLLDAGATIIGKNNMWDFSSGPSAYGLVENPNAPEYSIGGSSSGGAAAVAAADVDIAIGGDQGGSIRIPCSFSGIVGLKPTHGLVPYTAIFSVDATKDYTGPLTKTVEDAALAMDAIAGRDGLDPRQPHDLKVQDYTGALKQDISDMTVAILKEGFEHDGSDPDVIDLVREAVADLETMGAEIIEVSVPAHFPLSKLSTIVSRVGEGHVIQQNGYPTGFDGWYDTAMMEYFGRALDAQASDIPASDKHRPLVTEYLRRNYDGSTYGKTQNLIMSMREEYNEALADADALVMPTSPVKPPSHGNTRSLDSLLENKDSLEFSNTGQFNVTKHPALTVPCGTTDGAPVGLMFVGERFDDATLLQLGYAYEQYAN